MKKIIGTLIVIILVIIGAYFISKHFGKDGADNGMATTTDTVATTTVQIPTTATTTTNEKESLIGDSAGRNNIMAYHYGTGETELLFVGGIHGGYEWNTVLAAYDLMDYLEENPAAIPENIKVTVIPVLNPDGLKLVTGTTGRFTKADVSTDEKTVIAGRFNGNEVDLNRNFDCDWQTKATWQNKTVSGGAKVFSERESLALKSYVENHRPEAAIVWYSAAGGVYASNCHNGVSAETRTLMNTYAKASGYPAHEDFNFYEITGDAVNWLAKNDIPAISVLLTNHTDTEWTKNKAGIDAVLKYYAK